jgi:oligopeptide transport system ATP-binding protein
VKTGGEGRGLRSDPVPDSRPMGSPLVEVRNLVKEFPLRAGLFRRRVGAIQAVSDISFTVAAGQTLGLVGESGSGKSTTGRSLLHLDPPTSGEVLFRGEPLDDLHPEALRRARREMQMVFQDPYASLNPRHTVGAIVREPLEVHRMGTPVERRELVRDLLERVGLEASHAARFPHEFSGGQRQRVGIARALATRPAFVVADEPISALDVSIQAQIVNLLADIRDEMGLTYLFIAHDLAMVRHLCDRVAVMMLGKIVEEGPRRAVFEQQAHPYTRGLLAAVPRPDPSTRVGLQPPLQGELPDPADPPRGCRFHTRCPFATEICRMEEPLLEPVDTSQDSPRTGATEPMPPSGARDPSASGRPPPSPGHRVACHHAQEI